MGVSGLLWPAPLEDLKRGYAAKPDHYVCLFCGEKTEKGLVYSEGATFYEAERYMRLHIEKAHGSVFAYLIGLDKKLTGLSEHQAKLLHLFHQGKSDVEIQREMGIGSVSTVRNHRFLLKEKERQARLFLAIMDLVRDSSPKFDASKTQAESNNDQPVSVAQRHKILKKFLIMKDAGKMLKALPVKMKYRIIVLEEIAKSFTAGRIYNEKEVNSILSLISDDYVTLRRDLVDYGFIDRKSDGSEYWLKGPDRRKMTSTMDKNRKKQLKQEYKEMKTEAGVYQIRNIKNQKVFIISTPNLRTMNGQKAQLDGGTYRNHMLQQEWKEYGKDAFAFEVLEILKEKDEAYFDLKDELRKLEKKWLDKIQPFGEHGYHQPNRN